MFNEAGWDNWKKILNTLRDNGVEKVVVDGGEMAIHPMHSKLAIKLLNDFKQVTWQSNGILVNQNLLDAIDAQGFKNKLTVAVSIESSIHDIYHAPKTKFDNMLFDEVIRGRDHYASAWKSALIYKKRGFKTAIRATIFKQNNVIEMANECASQGFSLMVTRYIGVQGNSDTFTPTARQLAEIYRYFSNIEKRTDIFFDVNDTQYYIYNQKRYQRYHKLFDNKGTCQAQRGERIVIDPNGVVYPCFMFMGDKDFVMGNILKDSYSSILKNMEKFRKKINSYPFRKECENCPFKEVCNGGCAVYSAYSHLRGDPFCPLREMGFTEVK